jgi:glycosyltransferase involved in cell wall biosynthesis
MNGFKRFGSNEVKMCVGAWDKYPDKDIFSINGYLGHLRGRALKKGLNGLRKYGLLKKIAQRTDKDYHVLDLDHTITPFATHKILDKLDKAKFTPDVILILFMQDFLSFKNLYELNHVTNAPIFLYMMDMAPMTGGCHYAWECKGYVKKCGSCPALFSNEPADQTRINWDFKKTLIEKTDISVIAGTEWSFRQLQDSSLYENKNKFKILLSIDENTFKPVEKIAVRKQLALPIDKKIVFFGAASALDKRKGFCELMEALNILSREMPDRDKRNIHLAIAGKGADEFAQHLPYAHTMLGYLTHEDLPKAFQAADVFVSPSIEDAGPMMVNQSIMCATPVVSFEMGVALDLVETGQTGYRAKLGDIADLAKGLNCILDMDEQAHKKMRQNCRDFGLRLCHNEKQIAKFMQSFLHVLGTAKTDRV